MLDNDFTIIDIFKNIYKKRLLSFSIFFLILSVIFSLVLLYLQKDYFKPGYYEFSYDAYISNDYKNSDFLLIEKIHNLYQLNIFKEIGSGERERIFFNGKKMFLNFYFPAYYKLLNDENFISNFNKDNNKNYELVTLSGIKYSENERTYFKAVMKTSNGNYDDFNKYINQLNTSINNELKNESMIIYNSQEKININILKYLKSNLMKVSNNNDNVDFKLKIIDEYLNLLDKNHPDYLGNIIKNETINIASIENIIKTEIRSNSDFVILRSIILGILISFFLNFFIYTFRLGFFDK